MSKSTPNSATAKTASAPSRTQKIILENWRLWAVGALLVVIAATLFFRGSTPMTTSSDCSAPYRYDKEVKIGAQAIKVQTAVSVADQAKGLGGRACIGQNEGMLFIFDRPGTYSFWMKDMNFPIDMVWISAGHQAVYVKRNVQPSTYPENFRNSKPAQYVLELKANRSASLGLSLGTPVNF